MLCRSAWSVIMFIPRAGVAEVRSCAIHGGMRNCVKCFGCNSWYCQDECDLVHTCHGCGGTYCFHCRQCLNCAALIREGMARQPHADACVCECGSYLDLAGTCCGGCHRLPCLGMCERELLTNYCCRTDKCWRCSFSLCQLPLCVPNIGARRVCTTCPLPSHVVFRSCTFHDGGTTESELDAEN